MTLRIEVPPEREAELKAQAQALGLSVEQWLLRLAAQSAPPDRESLTDKAGYRPISEVIAEIMSDVPAEVLEGLPRDGASQIDHYLYGRPKQ